MSFRAGRRPDPQSSQAAPERAAAAGFPIIRFANVGNDIRNHRAQCESFARKPYHKRPARFGARSSAVEFIVRMWRLGCGQVRDPVAGGDPTRTTDAVQSSVGFSVASRIRAVTVAHRQSNWPAGDCESPPEKPVLIVRESHKPSIPREPVPASATVYRGVNRQPNGARRQ